MANKIIRADGDCECPACGYIWADPSDLGFDEDTQLPCCPDCGELITDNHALKVGDTIEIISMVGDHNEPRYNGRKGTIYMIDKYGMCYGDWEGTFPVDPKRDEYKIISRKTPTWADEKILFPECDKYKGSAREHMTEEREKEYIDFAFKVYENDGFLKTIKGTDFDGLKFKVLRRIETNEVDELYYLPMWQIRLENGEEIAAYPEEICKTDN